MKSRSMQSYLDSLSAVAELERADAPSTLDERVRQLRVVCRDAAALERRRQAAGLRPAEPEPWPESTKEFLRRQMERIHGG